MKQIRVIYMGTPEFAVPPLEGLFKDKSFEILAVVTQPDRKTGRKQLLTPSAVKNWAVEHDIPVFQPESIKKNTDFQNLISKLDPDIIVVTAYGNILPRNLLEIPKYGCVNIHGSLLPKYRGASPVEEALLNGDSETGITLILMDETLDAGPILHLERILIDKHDTNTSLRTKMSQIAGLIAPHVIKDYINEILVPIRQNDEKATYCKKISKDDGLIDIGSMSANEIFNMVRAYNPWPGAYLKLKSKTLKILETDVQEQSSLKPAEFAINDKKLNIGTKKGAIVPKLVQLEGKKPMEIQAFLSGNLELLKKELTSAK